MDAVRRVAAEQEGVVTREQALACGLSDRAITCHLESGRWQYVFGPGKPGKRPGVYAVFSGRIGRRARLWAAVLVCGRDAVLSHDSAAEMWGLYDPPTGRLAERTAVHVAVPAGRMVDPPAGIVRHYSRRLHKARHPARLPPCTRVEETVVDLTQTAAGLDAASAVIAQAVQRRLTIHHRIVAILTERRTLRWRPELLEACGVIAEGAQSRLELRYVRKVERAHALPVAVRQLTRKADGRGFVIDNRYGLYRTRVELDGQRGHTGDGVFRDMWRDNAAALDRDRQLRFGWDDVTDRNCQTAAVVAKVLIDNGFTGRIRSCGPGCQAEATLNRLLNDHAA